MMRTVIDSITGWEWGWHFILVIVTIHSSYLTVVSSEVEVDSLRGGPVPSAMTGSECDPDNSSAIPGGEPTFLVVALPAHRLLLLALGHPALPWQAQDVGVAAEDWAMLHSSEHPCSSQSKSTQRDHRFLKRGQYCYERLSSPEVTGLLSNAGQQQGCIVLEFFSSGYLGDLQ